MSLDLPAGVKRELEQYAQAEQVSIVDAASELILCGIRAARKKKDLISDADLDAYFQVFPGFKALSAVSDEEWEQVLRSARRMRKQGLTSSG